MHSLHSVDVMRRACCPSEPKKAQRRLKVGQGHALVSARSKGLSDEKKLKRKGRSTCQLMEEACLTGSSVTGPGTEAKRANVHTVEPYAREVGSMNEVVGLLLSPSKDWEKSY